MSDQLLLAIAGGVIAVFSTVGGLFMWWLIKSVINCVTDLKVLTEKIEGMLDDTKSIPKMKQDLNVLHEWRKNFEGNHK